MLQQYYKMNHFKSSILCSFFYQLTLYILFFIYSFNTTQFWSCISCIFIFIKHILHAFDLDAQTAVEHIFFFPCALLLLLTCRISTFLTLWKLCSPLSPSASLWVFVKWAVCAISAVLLDSLKLLWPAVCMSLFNDCPSVHCSAQLLSSTQLGHLSDQVADMFSFLFSSFLPFFRSLFLASHCKGTFLPSTQELLVSSMSFRHSPSLFLSHTHIQCTSHYKWQEWWPNLNYWAVVLNWFCFRTSDTDPMGSQICL